MCVRWWGVLKLFEWKMFITDKKLILRNGVVTVGERTLVLKNFLKKWTNWIESDILFVRHFSPFNFACCISPENIDWISRNK